MWWGIWHMTRMGHDSWHNSCVPSLTRDILRVTWVVYVCGMTHINRVCRIWRQSQHHESVATHVTAHVSHNAGVVTDAKSCTLKLHESVTTHVTRTNDSHIRRANDSCHTYKWPMSHIPMTHVTRTNDSCHIYKMTHVTHTKDSCHTYKWFMSHIPMTHVTHTKDSCHTYKWFMSHIPMTHVTHTKDSCHTYKWFMSRSALSPPMCTRYDLRVKHLALDESVLSVTWVVCMCDMSRWYVLHESFVCVTWVCVTWVNYMLQTHVSRQPNLIWYMRAGHGVGAP